MAKKDPKLTEMPSNCNFSDNAKPVVGKYYERYQKHACIVKLDDDVAMHFPDAISVNEALRNFLSASDSTNSG